MRPARQTRNANWYKLAERVPVRQNANIGRGNSASKAAIAAASSGDW